MDSILCTKSCTYYTVHLHGNETETAKEHNMPSTSKNGNLRFGANVLISIACACIMGVLITDLNFVPLNKPIEQTLVVLCMLTLSGAWTNAYIRHALGYGWVIVGLISGIGFYLGFADPITGKVQLYLAIASTIIATLHLYDLIPRFRE